MNPMAEGASALGSTDAYEAARLRRAGGRDAERLRELFRAARPEGDESLEEMRGWLEHGGALMLEDADGTLLCALRWREEEKGAGWRVDRVATLPSSRSQGFGRWLMTKVEALAIRLNVPSLSLTLDQDDLLPYYRRLGYQVESEGPDGTRLHKRVGGTWQTKGPEA